MKKIIWTKPCFYVQSHLLLGINLTSLYQWILRCVCHVLTMFGLLFSKFWKDMPVKWPRYLSHQVCELTLTWDLKVISLPFQFSGLLSSMTALWLVSETSSLAKVNCLITVAWANWKKVKLKLWQILVEVCHCLESSACEQKTIVALFLPFNQISWV